MVETLFYVFGLALVLSALVVSAVGLRSESFPSRIVLGGVVAYFVVLVGATSTFAVLNAREEQRVRDEEHAEEAAKAESASEEAQSQPGEGAPPGGGEPPPGTEPPPALETVEVSSPVDGNVVFQPSKLTARAGTVTIEYENPSPAPHSVAIEVDGETIDESETGTETTLTATADLEPGEFVFYCTVPGHRESGMEGTLTVE